MKILKLAGVLISGFLFYACAEDDTLLDLNAYEPFVNIAFYDTLDQPIETVIDLVQAENNNSFSFPDSATSFEFPLDINAGFSKFEITIGAEIGRLTVAYSPRVENQINVLRFILENTNVTAHSYDSVKVICEPNCISNETEIRIYR